MNPYSITQSGLISLLTFIIGQVVAFVPSLASKEQTLISLGSTLIALGFLIANAIHAHAKRPVGAPAPWIMSNTGTGGAVTPALVDPGLHPASGTSPKPASEP